VLAPFLTSCQEECPLTTGAFFNIEGKLAPRVRRLPTVEGLRNLEHADPAQSWTIPEALAAIGSVLGRRKPQS